MATGPAVDGNDITAATINRYLFSASGKTGIKVLFARLTYNGSAWVVSSSNDKAELVSGNLAWSTTKLTIVLSGYTVAPVALATQVTTATVPYVIQALATASNNIDVEFWDTAGAQVTTQATSMDFNLLVIGV